LFSKIADLTRKYNTKGKLTYFDTGRQEMILGLATEEQLSRLREETGLNVVFLK